MGRNDNWCIEKERHIQQVEHVRGTYTETENQWRWHWEEKKRHWFLVSSYFSLLLSFSFSGENDDSFSYSIHSQKKRKIWLAMCMTFLDFCGGRRQREWASSWNEEEERGIHSPDFSLTPPGKFKSISKVFQRRKFPQEGHRDGDDTKKKKTRRPYTMHNTCWWRKEGHTHNTKNMTRDTEVMAKRTTACVYSKIFDSSRENKKEDKSWMDEIWEEVRVWTSS